MQGWTRKSAVVLTKACPSACLEHDHKEDLQVELGFHPGRHSEASVSNGFGGAKAIGLPSLMCTLV